MRQMQATHSVRSCKRHKAACDVSELPCSGKGRAVTQDKASAIVRYLRPSGEMEHEDLLREPPWTGLN